VRAKLLLAVCIVLVGCATPDPYRTQEDPCDSGPPSFTLKPCKSDEPPVDLSNLPAISGTRKFKKDDVAIKLDEAAATIRKNEKKKKKKKKTHKRAH
jgi:hypothetical protein